MRSLQDGLSRAALSWLHSHLADFALPEDVDHPRIDRNVTLKPLGELAQISQCTLRHAPPGSEQRRTAGELLDAAWAEMRHGELFLTLVRGEPHATYPVEFYGAFSEAGLRHEEFEEYARFAAGTRAWRLTEHDPTRKLSLLNVQHRLGLPPGEDPQDAMRRTWLGGPAEPWAFELHAGYALTHHVFHVTNWGSAPWRLPGEVCDYLALWLPAWLDSCLEHGYWDLTGELLAVAACLPDPGAVPVTEAWRAYAAVQGATGAIPESGPVPDEDAEGTFLACYHSTLTGTLAAVLASARAADESERSTGGAET
ncbi:hypothetical protein HCC30_11180 [Streptomyces sp. HNM0574]|nr:hypothetical protein [Streptomyces sp. HNM0574]